MLRKCTLFETEHREIYDMLWTICILDDMYTGDNMYTGDDMYTGVYLRYVYWISCDYMLYHDTTHLPVASVFGLLFYLVPTESFRRHKHHIHVKGLRYSSNFNYSIL